MIRTAVGRLEIADDLSLSPSCSRNERPSDFADIRCLSEADDGDEEDDDEEEVVFPLADDVMAEPDIEVVEI